MNRNPKLHAGWAGMGTVAVLAIYLLVLAGCSGMRKTPTDPVDDLRAAIEQTVSDEVQKAGLLAHTDEWEQLLHQESSAILDWRETLDRLVADYNSEREDVEKFFVDYRRRRAELADRLIEVHMAMKNLTSDDQWTSLEEAAQRMTESVLRQDLAGAI